MERQILASSKARVVSKTKKIANWDRMTRKAKKQTGWSKCGMRPSPKGLMRSSPIVRFLSPAAGSLSQRALILQQVIARSEKKKKSTRKSNLSYNRHMFKVLNLFHPEFEFSVSSPGTFEKIALEAARVARYNEKPPIAFREIETTLSLLMTGELTKYAVLEETKRSPA